MGVPNYCAAQKKPHQLLLIPGPEALYLCVQCYKVLTTVQYGKSERLGRAESAAWAVRLARHQFGRFTRSDAEQFNAGDPAFGYGDLKAAVEAFYEMLGLVESMGKPAAPDAAMPALSKPAGGAS